MNGMRLISDANETITFLTALYESNQLTFDRLVPWLRGNGSLDPHASRLDESSRPKKRSSAIKSLILALSFAM
jgi:hypothetical protein